MARLRRKPGSSSTTRILFMAGELDAHRGAVAGLALDPDDAAVILDDALDDRQPEPGSVAPRREERVEDPRQGLGINAAAGVTDRDLDRFPSILGVQTDASRSVHRLGGIEQQVPQDLLQLSRVSVHLAPWPRRRGDDLDAPTRSLIALQQAEDSGDDLLEIDQLRAWGARTSKGEEVRHHAVEALHLRLHDVE